MLKVDGQCSKVIILMYILEVIHKITLYIGYEYGEVEVLIAQSCLTLCNTMDCNPPGSSLHGTLQARILDWVAILFSRGTSWLRDQIQVSCISGRFFKFHITEECQRLLVFTQFLTHPLFFNIESSVLGWTQIYLEFLAPYAKRMAIWQNPGLAKRM